MMLDELAGSQASLVSYSTVEKGKGKTKTSVAQYEVRGTSARAKRVNIWGGSGVEAHTLGTHARVGLIVPFAVDGMSSGRVRPPTWWALL